MKKEMFLDIIWLGVFLVCGCESGNQMTVPSIDQAGQFSGDLFYREVSEGVFEVDTTRPTVWRTFGKSDWKVVEHQSLGIVSISFSDGKMFVDGREVKKHFSKQHQSHGFFGWFTVHDLKQELADKIVMPDAILDLLIREQDEPSVSKFMDNYKEGLILFYGTIYLHPKVYHSVRCLKFFGGRWHLDHRGLGQNLDKGDISLVIRLKNS